MLFIFLCVLFSTSILIIFKSAGNQNLPALPIIVINYFIAAALGFLLAGKEVFSQSFNYSCLPYALLIGLLFFILFLIVAKTTEISGMTITSIASKMSVVFPVLFSIIVYHESLGLIKLVGIVLALIALFTTVYQPTGLKNSLLYWLLPLTLFIGNGFLDSLLKYTQFEYLSDTNIFLFNGFVFGGALIIGFPVLIFRKKTLRYKFNGKLVFMGILLGLVNFGSLWAMVKALNSHIDSSLVFIINNTGVVILAAIAGISFFKERLGILKLLGILLALLSIFLLTMQANGS